VPEAAMHEDHGAVLGKGDVWLAWEIASVQSESEPELVQHGANTDFRLSILPFDPGHVPTAPFSR